MCLLRVTISIHMDFKSSYKQLNTAQKKAVDLIDGPVLVIAGPGTGKTQLLALRAANILDKTDTAPQNILCLTYTEVGARNMRERLTRFIGQAAYDINISTYHGFGSEIIRRHGEYFLKHGVDKPVDAIGQSVIMHEIYDMLPTSNVLWRADVYLKDALAFISEAKRALLSPDDIRAIAKANEIEISNLNPIISKHLATLIRMGKAAIPMFKAMFVDMTKHINESQLPNAITPIGSMATTDLAEAILAVDQTGKTNALTSWKNTWLEKDNDNNWILGGLKECQKIRSGADIYDQYLNALNDKGLFDYDDMILRAIDGIEKHDALRYTLHEQYQYIMLDEFQDTNLAQLKLIDLLTNNPATEGRPNVLAVGDDDQAIFSFQGADLTNMLRFHAMYRDVTTITLTENWRSHNDILHVAKGISEQIEDRLHERLGFAEKVLEAKNPHLPKKANISRHEFKSDIAQFAWVASRIANDIKQGTDPGNIAVIAPKHKYLEPLVSYLNNHDIPVRYDKRENVLEDKHILSIITKAQLVAALSAGDYTSANSLWPAVLSSDEWQLPTSIIWQLSWQAHQNTYSGGQTDWLTLMLDIPNLRPIALYFARLTLLSNTETLEAMLDYLTGAQTISIGEADYKDYTDPYYEFYFGKAKLSQNPTEFLNLLSNLTVLRAHIREYKQDNEAPLQLGDLLEFVNAYENAHEKLLNTSPYHSAQNAVQLLTAYGSKGLEFDTVYVLATLDDVWGMKARGLSSNITLPKNLQIIRHAGSSKDERKRLFYVALTRAKHTLIMTSYSQDYSGKSSARLEFLAESEVSGQISSPLLPASMNTVYQTDHAEPQLDDIATYWHNRHIHATSQPDLRELLAPRLDKFQLSATHLNTFTDLVYGGPEKLFINTILKFPKAPSADGQYGNAIHETLETLHYMLRSNGELPDTEEVIDIFKRKLQSKKLSTGDYNRQLGRGEKALELFMPQWWPNFNPANEAEVQFRDEGVFVGDAHLSGNLDLLLIDHENQIMQVVDYKTGKPHSRWSKDVKMHKYRQQLLFYKLLIEGSHTYSKYTVEQGRLVFVEPTEDGKLAELPPLNYDNDEIKRTKELILAVWNRIKKLDFPDTSSYSKDLKGIIEFEDWLIENNS